MHIDAHDDTIHMKQLMIRFTPITMQCDSISNQYNAIQCNGKNMIVLFLWFRQTANHKLTCIF